MSDQPTLQTPSPAPGASPSTPLSGTALLRALLDDPLAPAKVAEAPGTWLHRLVCEVGLADSTELLEMATAEQVREVLDLELWQGDRLKQDDALDWFSFLSTLSEEAAGRHLRGLDVELRGFVLLSMLRIYLVEEETTPDEPQGVVWPTPDGWYHLEIMPRDEGDVDKVLALLDQMYRDDADATRRLLLNLMWELPAELEDWSLRWRNARLQDLGFADPVEALALYTYLDPASVEPAERTADRPLSHDPEPAGKLALAEVSSTTESFLSAALAAAAAADPAEEQRLAQAMMTLGNRALAADHVELADMELARRSLKDLHWRTSLGLEHLCQGEVDRAPGVLSSVALLRVARVGHSLALDLRRAVLPHQRRGRLGRSARAGVDLLDPPLCHHVQAMLLPYPRRWDEESQQRCAFHTAAELEQAWSVVQQLEQTLELLDRVQLRVELPEQVTHGDLVRTLVLNKLLGREGPVDAAALAGFIGAHVQRGALGPAVLRCALDLLQPAPASRHIVEGWIHGLEQSVAPLDADDLDLRFVDGLWLAPR